MRRKAWPKAWPKAWIVGLGSASILLSSLCGCSWDQIFSSSSSSLPNAVAVDRALRLCSLTEGEEPFHLILEISPPASKAAYLQSDEMRAHVEVFWLNGLTYRTVIQSPHFTQTRIVNGAVIEEHNTGDFYPRWIQNFVDALLNPVPQAEQLRKLPGKVPVGVQSHACITTPPGSDENSEAQICFQDAEPKIASGVDFTRSVWFDNFVPFGGQQIARTLVDKLPASILVRGEITLLEPLRKQDYDQVKAKEFTPANKQIQTALVSKSTAQTLFESSVGLSRLPMHTSASADPNSAQNTVYIRADRSGRVREAYPDTPGQPGQQDSTVARALTLKFKPLLIGGVPRQMEAPLTFPLTAIPETAPPPHSR